MPRVRPSTAVQTSLSLSTQRKRAVFKVKKRRQRKDGEIPQLRDNSMNGSSSSSSESNVDRPPALTALQQSAFNSFRNAAVKQSKSKLRSLNKRASSLGFSAEQVQRCLDFIRDRARLLIHIDLREKVEALLADDQYRSAYEQEDNCAERDRGWAERKIFKSYFNDAEPFERVKYGSLDLCNDPFGNARCVRKFGESFLVLRRSTVAPRTTVLDHDLFLGRSLGTLEHCAHVLNELPDDDLRIALSVGASGGAHSADSRELSRFVELHFFGPLRLDRDVAAIHMSSGDDRRTKSGKQTKRLVQQLARRIGCALTLFSRDDDGHASSSSSSAR